MTEFISCQYFFQKKQTIGFCVIDDDGSLDGDDNLGKTFLELGTIVQAGEQGVSRKLKAKGEIILTAVLKNVPGSGEWLLRARGENLDKKDLFGQSDPFYEIYVGKTLIARSEYIKNCKGEA